MTAASKGCTEICVALIAAGADVNAMDKVCLYGCVKLSIIVLLQMSWTALTSAAARGHAESCRVLIAAGANVDAKDNV